MDDLPLPVEALQPCAPKLAAPPECELPAGFVPMRLLLHPGGLCVDVNKPQMIVGRHSEADVRLGLPDVSRRHCRFVFADDSWQVYDLNSLNGVFVNGERLHQAVVRHGDRIRIGSLTFDVDLGTDMHVSGDARLPVRKAS